MYPATAREVPFLKRPMPRGDDISFELHSELGVSRIEGASEFNVFHRGLSEMPGFVLHQGGGKYVWDAQTAFGQIERSSWENTLIEASA